MPVSNADVADIFNEIADALEIEEANPFRVRAYRNAAQTLLDLSRSVAAMIEAGEDLSELPGIGKDLEGKIIEIVETGTLGALKKLEAEVPPELTELLHIPGLGPKRVHALHTELDINSLQDLEAALEAGKVRELEGFGKKTEENIGRELAQLKERSKRFKWAEVEELAQTLIKHLQKVSGVKSVVVAGSYRRHRDTVGDLDILVTASDDEKVMANFVDYDTVDRVISKGHTRSTVVMRNGLQVDLRVVEEQSFGAALHYFTGSKSHNIAVRTLGVRKGLKINEYGVFRDDERIAGATEEEVYEQVGLPYIEPELRENHGEIEAASEDRLPELITTDDIRGDLHAHTKYTDGHDSLEDMAKAARERGYEYLAITDHSKHVTVAKGLDVRRLKEQCEAIDRLNEKLEDIRLLKGCEVDILEDGSLDLPDSILKQLDVCVVSVHYKFDLSRKKQTERILRALDNPCVNILAHPSGRLLGKREPYDVDMEKIMSAAKERGCYLEVNGQPARLDLHDVHCHMAKDMGLKLAISTDAHNTRTLDNMRLGVAQARRGWIEADDVINTRPLDELLKLLKRA